MAKKTAKQKEFDLLLKYGDKPEELTKRIRTDDIELMEKYKDKLNWYNISNRDTITNEFIDKFWDKMKPIVGSIVVHPNMHIDFLKTNREYINWNNFVYESSGTRFTVDFIKEFEKELSKNIERVLH